MKAGKFVSTFLSARDLADMGPTLVNIETVEEEQVGGETKPVLRGWGHISVKGADSKPSVEGREVVIALNPTNILSLTELFGSDETDDWLSECIVAYNDPSVMFNNKKVGGIRFRKPKPGFEKPARPHRTRGAQTVEEKDIPF